MGDATVVSVPADCQAPQRVPPLARPPVLDGYEGKWVLLVGDVVAASADTSHDLAVALDQLEPGERARGVMQFVRPLSGSYVVGAG